VIIMYRHISCIATRLIETRRDEIITRSSGKNGLCLIPFKSCHMFRYNRGDTFNKKVIILLDDLCA
jgi:hypothetical protein